MAKSLVGALALASLPSALAFHNTSPFFLLSTSDLNLDGNDAHFAQSSTVAAKVTEALKECPSESYFVIRQEGVPSADFESQNTAHLGGFLHSRSSTSKSTMQIAEVVGNVDSSAIAQYLQKQCGAELVQFNLSTKEEDYPSEQVSQDGSPRVYEIGITASDEDFDVKMASTDTFINYAVSRYAPQGRHTIIFATTPSENRPAQSGEHTLPLEETFQDPVQMELKRDLSSHRRADDDNDDGVQDEGGLFERYQYLSPGLFMGISATIPLVLILIVGLRAISGLEVSYFAFSKEMGPAAQRKQ